MSLLVNHQLVPEALILEESERFAGDPAWNRIPDSAERDQRRREAAEYSAVNRFVFELAAANDPRPIDPSLLHREVEQQKTVNGCRAAFEDTLLRQQIEKHLRMQRLAAEMVANAPKPSPGEIESFHQAHRENFKTPDTFHAAHILLSVDETQTEPAAGTRIEAALAELASGEDFAAVAERYSDCKGNGGDLGVFPAGYMVAEFEAAIRKLEPGQRTGIFTTPFGFHIAELRARTTGGLATFDEVRPDIERVLAAMYEHREYLKGVAALRSKAVIERVTHAGTGP